MNPHLLVFQDFHIHGASAPEWHQRYWQMSPGVMRSTLDEWATDSLHVFRKWMSERVVQQGSLPPGQLCFALLGSDTAAGMRVQGREFAAGDLLILRGGDEFEIQRPAGVELLSATFGAEAFLEFLDASSDASSARRVLATAVIRPDGGALAALRQRLRAQVAARFGETLVDFMQAAREVLARSGDIPRQRMASVAAAALVKECQHIALSEYREQPLRIEDLCARLRTSRRTLQNSFRQVTGASPLVYLRHLRLNAVRRRLMATTAGELSVSQAAIDGGFDHLGRFAGSYRALFGETPSRTVRL